MVKKIGSQGELNAELEAATNKLVVVDFFATWCGPCKMIAPKLEAMVERYGGKLIVLKVDVDEAEELAAQYNISAMPTFILFKNKQQIDTLLGANEVKLTELIEKHI